MRNKDLINYCTWRESEICTQCEHRAACIAFTKKYGVIPYRLQKSKYYTDEELEEEVGK